MTVEKMQPFPLHLVSLGVEFGSVLRMLLAFPEMIVMKRLILLMVLVTLVAGMTGCRSRMLGRRGARCRPEPPQMQMPMQPDCEPTCGDPGLGQVVIPQGAVITEGTPMVTQEFPTSPIVEQGGQIVERQVVTVPGPESAPLPRN